MGLKLHLGCWHRYLPGFVHVDLCDMPHIDFQASIDSLPMFADGSAELIYSSHSFTYFDRAEAERALSEWNRVLEHGGLLRLAVPDFDTLVQLYIETGELQHVLGPLYGRMEIETAGGRQTIYMRTAYNFKHLKALLETNGFTNVRRYDWRSTIHRDYDDHSQAYYPHMDKTNGLLISLNIEADKP